MTATAAPGQRVLGWDLLRGLCALAVAVYHLLMWQQVALLNTFGSYGVYLFFILSGASLTYTYASSLEAGRFRFTEFLWVRYVRLAPLYLALMLLLLPWKIWKEGATAALAAKLVLNVSFLFGFHDPAVNAMLIGGWSLGIEAIYYLLFPVLAWAALRRHAGWMLLAGLALLQVGWIAHTVGAPGGYAAHAVAYHQAPAFAAYFMGGCLLGQWQRTRPALPVPAGWAVVLILAGFGLLWGLNPPTPGDELLGWRGAACAALCFAMAWIAGGVRLKDRFASAASHLGDATYGLYLIHPVLFYGLVWVVLPRLGLGAPATWNGPAQAALTLVMLLFAFVLALLSERYFEQPLRRRSKRGLAGRVPG